MPFFLGHFWSAFLAFDLTALTQSDLHFCVLANNICELIFILQAVPTGTKTLTTAENNLWRGKRVRW